MPTEKDHRRAAKELSIRMGFGEDLVGGETKQGFAYIPISGASMQSVEWAADIFAKTVCHVTPSHQNPENVASAILKIAKAR